MNCLDTPLSGCFVIEPKILVDDRGYFMERFNERTFEQLTATKVHFVQDNLSMSHQKVLRGLHYQTGEHAQAKLVSVLSGEVLDVVVDLRPESSTYGQHFSITLSAENQKQLFIPRGFAHGFSVLSDNTQFFYKCDNYYNRESEGGIYCFDPELAIDWNGGPQDFILSEKDAVLPGLKNAKSVW